MARERGIEMAEVTYLSEVECEVVVPNGMLDTQVIRVPDAQGQNHVLRVARGGLVEKDDKKYLPVGLVHVDRQRRLALIELPEEADSGTSRLWIAFTHFRRQEPACASVS
jgi:hypothetical protein